MTVWLLGDQLHTGATPLDDADRVLLVEAHDFAARRPYHPHKLTLLYSAMRHARDRLRDQGYEVAYHQADTFGEGLDAYFQEHPGDDLTLMRPASHGAADRLRRLVEERGGTLDVVGNECFLTTPGEFESWAEARDGEYRHEDWYRYVRRETGYLMESAEGDTGDEQRPVGGEWNYDPQNRETPPPDWEPPDIPRFDPDDTTREVQSWVRERFGDGWSAPGEFVWPVTREEALDALDHFVEHRLPEFGPYQDAMVDGEWALCHSLLSPALNLGLLRPREVVERAIDAYDRGHAPINSVEGFVRQIIGWREFVRHVYRDAMPEMADANQLGLARDLPPLYYTGETEMECLTEAVGHVRTRGYAHHIERLMVLSNFAVLAGADPHDLNAWFQAGFVDGYHWVATPNVVGMGTFATDALSSKPYVASANYIDGMSDYCAACPYDPDQTVGEDACPFNALYWDFLDQHEETLRGTGRMGLVYSHLDDKRDDEARFAQIRERADEVRQALDDETL